MRAMSVPLQRADWSLEQLEVSESPVYQGKASAVFRAKDKESGAIVALKSYKKAVLTALNARQVERELKIHLGLCHENIIQLYGTFEDEDHVYMVQEFADDGDLFQKVKCSPGARFNEAQARGVMLPFLGALVYLHSQGILHRDIKPENVVIGAGGAIKLIDFGLAIRLHDERPVTRLGTLDYMAPEVLSCPDKTCPFANKDRKDLEYSCQVDVWAAGVLMYELLVGRPPFEQETRLETYQHIMYQDPPVPECLSPHAASFIKAALCKDPAERPTALELKGHPWLSQALPSLALSSTDSMGLGPTTMIEPPASDWMAAAADADDFSHPFVVVDGLFNCSGQEGHDRSFGSRLVDDESTCSGGIYSDSDCGSDSHSFHVDDGGMHAHRQDIRHDSSLTHSSTGEGSDSRERRGALFDSSCQLRQDGVQLRPLPPTRGSGLGIRGMRMVPPSETLLKLPPATATASTSALSSPQPSISCKPGPGPAMPEIVPYSTSGANKKVKVKTAIPDISALPHDLSRDVPAPEGTSAIAGSAHSAVPPEGAATRAASSSTRRVLARNLSCEGPTSTVAQHNSGWEPPPLSTAFRRVGSRLVNPPSLDLDAVGIHQADGSNHYPAGPALSPGSLLMGSISAEASALLTSRSADLDSMQSTRDTLEAAAKCVRLPRPAKAGVLSADPDVVKQRGSSSMSLSLAALLSPTPHPDDAAPDPAPAPRIVLKGSQACKAVVKRAHSGVSSSGRCSLLQRAVEVLDRGPGIFRRAFLPSFSSQDNGGLVAEPSLLSLSKGAFSGTAKGKVPVPASALPLLRAQPGISAGAPERRERDTMCWKDKGAEPRASSRKANVRAGQLLGSGRSSLRSMQLLSDAEMLRLRRATSYTNMQPDRQTDKHLQSVVVRQPTHSSPGYSEQ